MSSAARRAALYAALAVLYLLHNDLWLWRDARTVLGLPVGFTYHVAYSVAAAALFALLVRHAWPSHLSAPQESARIPEDGAKHV